jgi:hypothetical protein
MRWNNKNIRRKKEKFQEKVNSLVHGSERGSGINSLNNLKNPKTKNS